MTPAVSIRRNTATEAEIADHLRKCAADFVPDLLSRVELSSYAQKIARNATRFEAWADGALVGFLAAYCNDCGGRSSFITSVSVLSKWKGRGIASDLMEHCVEHVRELGFAQIELEVDAGNAEAIRFYQKNGFVIDALQDQAAGMRLTIRRNL